MDCVCTEELALPSAPIWDRVQGGEEFVVTRAGDPIALLVRTDAETMHEQLRQLRLARFGALVRRIQADAVASGASQITEEEIQAEIDAARREAAAKAVANAKAGTSGDN